MIIDMHSHIKRDYVNPKEQEEALLADMERNAITKRVVSALDGKSTAELNEYISGFVSKYPEKLIGCAVINPKEYDCLKEAQYAFSLPGMKMLELNSLEHGYYPDSCEGVEAVLQLAEEKGIPVKVFTGIGARSMPQQWMKHVKKHPSIPFLFLHMGCFDYGYGCIDLAMEADNLYLETSNQYEVQILKKAVTKLPKEKLMFGSSYPERLTKCSIDVFDMFHLDQDHLDHIFYKNALYKERKDDSNE